MAETMKPKNIGYLASKSNLFSLSFLYILKSIQAQKFKKTCLFFQRNPKATREEKKPLKYQEGQWRGRGAVKPSAAYQGKPGCQRNQTVKYKRRNHQWENF